MHSKNQNKSQNQNIIKEVIQKCKIHCSYKQKAVYNKQKLSKITIFYMLCNNVSYHTERDDNNCQRYCAGSNVPKQQFVSYNYMPTLQSQRNPSNYYQDNSSRRQFGINQEHLHPIQEYQTLQLMNGNTKRQYKKIQAIQRNKKLASILSILLAFSQRLEKLKQKLAGYPAESFSPIQFFNVLDLAQKGYVNVYDIKRFVNNDKIRQKDIIALYKKVNGDHSKDNTRLTYFGFLTLIKPYFNEELAKDLLMRDTIASRKNKKTKGQSSSPKFEIEMVEPTQESVLLLFQELILLHCISITEHEQAKQLLMNEYMLNISQIKQIIGLSNLSVQNQLTSRSQFSQKSSTKNKHKNPLFVLFQFIQNNSNFEVHFQQLKFILSYLNAHQYSLANQKYMSLLFLPTSCKAQLLKQIQNKKSLVQDYQQDLKSMNIYLTKENLLNRGNIQPIRQFLDEKLQNSLSAEHIKIMKQNLGSSKSNFLEFVHPNSLGKVGYPMNQNIIQKNYQNYPIPSPHIANQHPSFLINASNKNLSQRNQGGVRFETHQSRRSKQFSNNSSVPQQNIKINPLRQNITRQDRSTFQLKGQFYEQNGQNMSNISNISKTPFLEQFMKESNIIKNVSRGNQYQRKTKIANKNQSNYLQSSHGSESAFQVVQYGYEPDYEDTSNSYVIKNKKLGDQSSRNKKGSLQSQYDQVIRQYKVPQSNEGQPRQINENRNNLFSIQQNAGYSRNLGIQKKGQNSRYYLNGSGNYIDAVGMSQSNMINESRLPHKNMNNSVNNQSVGLNRSRNILDEFLKR